MKKLVPADAVLIPQHAKCMFRGVIYDTYQWKQELFDGSHTTFEMLRRPDTVTAICIVDDELLVLKDEQPHRGLRINFPGGRANDENEDITLAAQREALEETGYEFNNWRLVKVWQPHTKIEQFIYLFIAWDVASVIAARPDAGELITVERLPFDEVKKLVFDKVGYLGEAQSVFENINSTKELLTIPGFVGKEIER